MKTSARLIATLLTLAALLMVVLWSIHRSEVTKDHPIRGPETAASATDDHHVVGDAAGIERGNMPESSNDVIPQPSVSNMSTQNRSRALEGINAPIRFWGKVMDQNDVPLPGTRIKTHVRTWASSAVGLATFPKLEAVSDVDGRFELSGAHGDVLTIDALEKEGYESEPNALRSFGYNTAEQFRASPESPILFRMWETSIKEPLTSGERRFTLIPDGRPHTIDLAKGTIAESAEAGGDLVVSVTRPKDIVFGQRYDWACEIRVLNGGVVEAAGNHSSMFLAPLDGYVEAVKYEQKADQSGWGDSTGTRRFYLKLRNGGVYGRIELQISAYYSQQIPSCIRVGYLLNPTGSRVLR